MINIDMEYIEGLSNKIPDSNKFFDVKIGDIKNYKIGSVELKAICLDKTNIGSDVLVLLSGIAIDDIFCNWVPVKLLYEVNQVRFDDKDIRGIFNKQLKLYQSNNNTSIDKYNKLNESIFYKLGYVSIDKCIEKIKSKIQKVIGSSINISVSIKDIMTSEEMLLETEKSSIKVVKVVDITEMIPLSEIDIFELNKKIFANKEFSNKKIKVDKSKNLLSYQKNVDGDLYSTASVDLSNIYKNLHHYVKDNSLVLLLNKYSKLEKLALKKSKMKSEKDIQYDTQNGFYYTSHLFIPTTYDVKYTKFVKKQLVETILNQVMIKEI